MTMNFLLRQSQTDAAIVASSSSLSLSSVSSSSPLLSSSSGHHLPPTSPLIKLPSKGVMTFGTARSLQNELNQIALIADTSTSKGISYVLTETIRALLQHPDYFISAYSSVNTKKRFALGEKLFNRLSVEERGNFDEETLVNVINKKKQIKRSPKATGTSSEFIVVKNFQMHTN